MMRLAGIRGQSAAVLLLRRLLARGRLPHAILLEGPAGCGRRTVARALAAAALCHAPMAGDACGACISCVQMEGSAHPDLVELPNSHEPVPEGLLALAKDGGEGGVTTASGRLIPASWARWIADQACQSAMLGHGRAFILPAVERFNLGAANALLKVLEEPPAGVRFLMTTGSAAEVLKTVRSRAQLVRMLALSADDVAAIRINQGEDPVSARRDAISGLRGTGSIQSAAVAGLVRLATHGWDAAAVAAVADALPATPSAQAEKAGLTTAAEQRRALRAWLQAAAQSLRTELRGSAPAASAANIQRLLDLIHDIDRNLPVRLVIEALAAGGRTAHS
jgi:replication-associated recombination protein RarA